MLQKENNGDVKRLKLNIWENAVKRGDLNENGSYSW